LFAKFPVINTGLLLTRHKLPVLLGFGAESYAGRFIGMGIAPNVRVTRPDNSTHFAEIFHMDWEHDISKEPREKQLRNNYSVWEDRGYEFQIPK
jgi:hypothetical protein